MSIRDKNIHRSAAISLSKIQGMGLSGPIVGNPRYVIKGAATAMLTWINERVKEEYIHATIDEAINAAAANSGANRGDKIWVLPGHTETVSTASGITADVAGLEIIGVGHGADTPTITFSATDSTIVISAASVSFKNFLLVPSIDAVVSPIVISGANCTVDVEVRDATALIECTNAILTTATADNLDIKVKHVGFISGSGSTNCVRLVGANHAKVDVDFYGIASTAIVEFHTTASTNVEVSGRFYNYGSLDGSKDIIDTVTGSNWTVDDSAYLKQNLSSGEADPRKEFYVDGTVTTSGDGLSWATAVKTIAEGVALVTERGSTVYVGGTSYSEAPVTVAIGDTKLIAVQETKQLPLWQNSTPTVGAHLTLSGHSCEVRGFRFHHTTNTVPAILIDGQNSVSNRIIDNYFTSGDGIEGGAIGISYQAYDNEFRGNEFFALSGSGLSTGAIYEIAGMANVPVANVIDDNRFFHCKTCISLSSKWSTITNNHFIGVSLADVQVTEVYINLLHVYSAGDGLQDGSHANFGGNLVAGNYFGDLFSWEINSGNGFRFGDTDAVSGNYCKDGIAGHGGPSSAGSDAADTQLVPGKNYSLKSASVALTGGNVTLWTIAGGPIKLTSLGLQIVTATNATSKVGFSCTPTNGGETDVTATDASGLEINAQPTGELCWSQLDASALDTYDIDSGSIPALAAGTSQIIPPGTFQLTMEDSTPTTGAADVYIEFSPLGPGVSVTPA